MNFEKLRELYGKIPVMKCIEGCTDCCGTVPFSREEWEAVEDKRPPPATGIKCPYADRGCDIYELRPMMCRLFGAAKLESLRFPHGCRPEKLLSAAETSEIMSEYLRWKDDTV